MPRSLQELDILVQQRELRYDAHESLPSVSALEKGQTSLVTGRRLNARILRHQSALQALQIRLRAL